MIILEGPDGAGKTTLLNVLQERFQLPQHERFSTSEGGPVEDVARKAFRDIQSIHTQPLSIYDRHPMLSEYVYRTAIPELMVRDEFLEGWAMNMLKQFSKACLVIFCIPPYPEVKRNVQGCASPDCGHFMRDHPASIVGCASMQFGEPCLCTEWTDRIEMPGVVDNIAAIYQMYRLLHVFWPEPNRAILYDYTQPESIKRVLSRCQIHISEWNKGHVYV